MNNLSKLLLFPFVRNTNSELFVPNSSLIKIAKLSKPKNSKKYVNLLLVYVFIQVIQVASVSFNRRSDSQSCHKKRNRAHL